MNARRAMLASLVGLALILPGCEDAPKTSGPQENLSKPATPLEKPRDQASAPKAGFKTPVKGPAPTYADLSKRYNARAAKLDKLRSPVSLIIRSIDENGKATEDQVEGNLQAVAPRSVALRVDKVSQTIFYLGSNDTQYWSIDRNDPAVARIGTHDGLAAQAENTDLGLPIHPLDVIELLGITSLPPVSADGVGGGRVSWSADGQTLLVSVHGRWSTRRLRLDPVTLEPVRIELLNAKGEQIVTCDLSAYIPVTVRAGVSDPPRMASRLVMTQLKTQGSIRLNVVAPENPGDRMKAAPFDLKLVLDAYPVERVIDLDKAGVPAPRKLAPRSGGQQK